MSHLGIGIVTYDRLDHLRRCVGRVREHTVGDYQLLVADDGSADGTRAWCEASGVPVVGLSNRGVCWNKNRALFGLAAAGCDPILLLEDDCWPAETGWDAHWRVATALHGHVTFAHPKLRPWHIGGGGTATDPITSNKSTAQCASVSAAVLHAVGFLDSRFRGYGVGHAEWTTRIKRAGAGYRWAELEGGGRSRANLYIHGRLEAHDAPTFKDRADIARNEAVFDAIRGEPIHRHPWTTAEERDAFVGEMEAAGIEVGPYLAAASSGASAVDRLSRTRRLRDAVSAALSDPEGVMARDGWLDGLVRGPPVHRGAVVPTMSYAALNFLDERLTPGTAVLLIGGGEEGAWWAGMAGRVSGLLRDAGMVDSVRTLVPPGRRERIGPFLPLREGGNAELVARSPRGADVVFVGVPLSPPLAVAAVGALAPGGVVLVGEAAWPEARGAPRAFAERGFRELPLTSPGPGRRGSVRSVLFYRAANGFGI